MTFKDLHHQSTPLLICNVWDAMSARTAAKLGFDAIGTSSAAMANMLGYEDGEVMPFAELCHIVERIVASCNVPLTVDIEAGYSRDAAEVVTHIKTLAALGIVGINIEDSVIEHGAKTDCHAKRQLLDADHFSKWLAGIKAKLKAANVDVFINVRIDTYITAHNDVFIEAQRRAALYEQAGADGIFVPCIEMPDEISALVKGCSLPVNVMCMPQLPNFAQLDALGVKRISMGNFVFDNMRQHLESTLGSLREAGSFEGVF